MCGAISNGVDTFRPIWYEFDMPEHKPNQLPLLMTLKEVCDYLRVSNRTIYRMIKSGRPPATKIGRDWRFRRADVEDYLTNKKFSFGMESKGHYFFKPEVLDKYRSSPHEYYLTEEANTGQVGSRHDWAKWKKMQGFKRSPLPGELFIRLRYNKATLKNGQTVLIVKSHEFSNLPAAENIHWSGFVTQQQLTFPDAKIQTDDKDKT